MYLSNFDDYHNYQLAAFYSAYTCVYFSTLLSALFFTNYVYSIGKYSFYPVIGVIVVAEYTKFLLGTFHFSKVKGGRYDAFSLTKRNHVKNKIYEIFKSSIIIFVMLMVFFVLVILFGAQVQSQYEETIMLCTLLCSLTIFPACLHLGSSSVLSVLFGIRVSRDALYDLLLCGLRYTLLGTWVGSFVIPLDWDRPWQVWPIPCASGAMFGFMFGNFIMFLSLLPEMLKKYYYKSGKKC